MAVKKRRKPASNTAARRRAAKKRAVPKRGGTSPAAKQQTAKKKAAKKKAATRRKKTAWAPAYLSTRHYKKMAETVRRQRISESHQERRATAARRPRAPADAACDLSTGFDPQTED